MYHMIYYDIYIYRYYTGVCVCVRMYLNYLICRYSVARYAMQRQEERVSKPLGWFLRNSLAIPLCFS